MLNNTNKKFVVFCGYNVFPIGLAQTQRLLLITKRLRERDCEITFLCTYGTYNEEQFNIKSKGNYEGINYEYCSGASFRSSSFLIRNFRKVKGLFRELFILCKYRFSGRLDYIFLSTNHFNNVIYYFLISKILFVHGVIDNTEFFSAHPEKNKISTRLHDYLSAVLFNKIICISDYLYNYTLKRQKNKNICKIPVLVDFAKFDTTEDSYRRTEKRILYCGTATYYAIIDFIISSFELTHINSLKLIIVASGGSETDLNKLNSRIKTSLKSGQIEHKSNLSYNELTDLYINSDALLIPLKPDLQDVARFPHKLGEYCASKNIIITTNNGEIPNYFTDMENALVAKEYNTILFAEKMEYAINNLNTLNYLREASYKTGIQFFDYKTNGDKIYQFLFQS